MQIFIPPAHLTLLKGKLCGINRSRWKAVLASLLLCSVPQSEQPRAALRPSAALPLLPLAGRAGKAAGRQ